MTLAIDASTKSTGYSIFDKDKLIVYGLITASSTDVIARIYKIINGLKNIISQYSIDTVVLEEVRPENNQYGVGNIHTHKVLMWLQAAIAFMIHDNFKDIQIEYIQPSEWRKLCNIQTGRGKKRETLKQDDINFVNNQFNLNITSDDVADAIAINIGYQRSKSTPLKTKGEINWE